MALLENDPNLQFLQQMFDGDLYDGLNYVVWLFEQETQDLLDYVHIETRLLFGIYIAFVSSAPISPDVLAPIWS